MKRESQISPAVFLVYNQHVAADKTYWMQMLGYVAIMCFTDSLTCRDNWLKQGQRGPDFQTGPPQFANHYTEIM